MEGSERILWPGWVIVSSNLNKKCGYDSGSGLSAVMADSRTNIIMYDVAVAVDYAPPHLRSQAVDSWRTCTLPVVPIFVLTKIMAWVTVKVSSMKKKNSFTSWVHRRWLYRDDFYARTSGEHVHTTPYRECYTIVFIIFIRLPRVSAKSKFIYSFQRQNFRLSISMLL